MWQNAHDAYMESRILSADGLELVRLLYQACISAVREARRRLAEGQVAARARSINKAWEILAELAHSLDRERGGEIAARLAALYDYMQHRLIAANSGQADEPLVEILGLLSNLLEAWDGIQVQAGAQWAAGRFAQAAPPAPGRTERLWNL